MATLSVLLGLVFAAASIIEGKEGLLINSIVAVVFLLFFGWLAWFSRRVIGGIKKTGIDASESDGVAQGIMMANIMEMNDSSDTDIDMSGFD